MLITKTNLFERYPSAYSSLNRPLTVKEVGRLAFSVFGQQLSGHEAGKNLNGIDPHLRPLFALTLRLLDTGQRRAGSIERVHTFCLDHLLTWIDWDVREINEIGELKFRFIQALAKAFPVFGQPDQVVDLADEPGISALRTGAHLENRPRLRAVHYVAVFLTREYLCHVNRAKPEGGMPFFITDGASAVGKTEIFKSVADIFAELGRESLLFDLDMFLKDRSWRIEQEKKFVDGEIDSATFDESTFWDWDRARSKISEIVEFRRGKDAQRELMVPNAYDSRLKVYRDMVFMLSKGQIDIFVCKYANLEILNDLWGEGAFRCRLIDNPGKIRAQFSDRYQGGIDFDRRMAFYDLVLVPSFGRYAQRTAHVLNGQLNMSPEDDD